MSAHYCLVHTVLVCVTLVLIFLSSSADLCFFTIDTIWAVIDIILKFSVFHISITKGSPEELYIMAMLDLVAFKPQSSSYQLKLFVHSGHEMS